MFNLAAGGGNIHGYNAEFTWVAFLCCLIAASGGALFGYDNGNDPKPWYWHGCENIELAATSLDRVSRTCYDPCSS